jgi:hypothetical protein
MAEDHWSRLGRELLDLERDLGPDAAHRLWNDRRARRSRSRNAHLDPARQRVRIVSGAPGRKHPPPEPGEDESLERGERPWLR